MVAHSYKVTGSRISPGTLQASPKTGCLEQSANGATYCSSRHSLRVKRCLNAAVEPVQRRVVVPTGKIWANAGKREGETCSSCLYRSRDLKGRGTSKGSWEGQQKPQGPAPAVQEASYALPRRLSAVEPPGRRKQQDLSSSSWEVLMCRVLTTLTSGVPSKLTRDPLLLLRKACCLGSPWQKAMAITFCQPYLQGLRWQAVNLRGHCPARDLVEALLACAHSRQDSQACKG